MKRFRRTDNHMRCWLILLAGVVISLFFLASTTPTLAHGYLIRTLPEDQAVLPRSPARIQVWFSEGLESAFSTLTVTDERGQVIPLESAGVSATNPAQLSARLPKNLPNGAYVVTIRAAFTSDGHVGTETILFWVGARGSTVVQEGAEREANRLEIIWRALLLPALYVLCGGLLLYQSVLLPAWGNPRYKAGKLPPRVMHWLDMLLWAALVVVILTTIMSILQYTMTLFATTLSRVLRDGTWSVALNETQVGTFIRFRLIVLILMTVIHAGTRYLRLRLPEFISALYTMNLVLGVGVLFTMSATSHAAGATLWTLGSIMVDWLHLLATSAWIGGLATLALLLPSALTPLNRTEQGLALAAVLKRFSVLAVATVSILIITGLFSSAIHIQQPNAMTQTPYGLWLMAKLIIVAPLLLLGLYHHLIVAPGWLAKLAEQLHLANRFDHLVHSLRLESIGGVLVLLATAVLSATPPPIPDRSVQATSAQRQSVIVGDMWVELAVDPGAVGANSYEVLLQRGEQPVEGAQVTLQFSYPTLDKRSLLLTLDEATNGLYIGAGQELSRSGDWVALVDIHPAGTDANTMDGLPIRAAFRWPVPEVAPDANARQPNFVNWLSLFGVAVVLLSVSYRPVKRRIQALHLKPEGVIIGVGAAIGTLGLMIMGAVMLNNASQAADRLRNPAPLIVNPILPDQASLQRGQAIFQRECISCHKDDATGITKQRLSALGLARLRDEELYGIVVHGTNQLPMISLGETERWDVINYIRAKAP